MKEKGVLFFVLKALSLLLIIVYYVGKEVIKEISISKKEIICVEKDEKYGFIDETGEWIVEPCLDNANAFTKDGIAPVKFDGKWGFIDKKGTWIIPPKFSDIGSSLDESMFPVQFDDGKYGYVC